MRGSVEEENVIYTNSLLPQFSGGGRDCNSQDRKVLYFC